MQSGAETNGRSVSLYPFLEQGDLILQMVALPFVLVNLEPFLRTLLRAALIRLLTVSFFRLLVSRFFPQKALLIGFHLPRQIEDTRGVCQLARSAIPN